MFHGTADTIELLELAGPFKGQIRPYSRTAAENAIANGWAEIPEEEGDTVEPEAPFAEELTSEGPPADDSLTVLPEDFPGRTQLLAAGLESVESVRACEELRAVDGIGRALEKKILAYLKDLMG